MHSHSHLLYKSENRNNAEHRLLDDVVHCHFHVLTDDRRCFKKENTYTKHFHSLCSVLSDEKIQLANKSRVLTK